MTGDHPALTFHGGAGTVTGSKYLVESGDSKVLVDCGLFQGLSDLRRRNWKPLPPALAGVNAVVVTHAHLDHCGYLPVLVRSGWSGPIYVTPGSAGLVPIILRDSAHLMMEESAHANKYGWSKHKPALPLYDEGDAAKAIRLLRTLDFGQVKEVAPGIRMEFGRAGHILGSAWAHLTVAGDRSVVFSGDLGRPKHGVLRAPQPRPDCDTLVLESTYGARTHQDAGAMEEFAETIRRTARRGGSVLIPAFAVDRTEVILVALTKLMRSGAIPDLPVFVDSPMALGALRVYREAMDARWPEIRTDLGHNPLDPGHLIELRTADESMQVNRPRMPSIIISASGMASGGRVLHHLSTMLPDNRHTVLIVGYAAAGTRSRQLINGARELKIHGRYYPVRAEVAKLDAFSAHADSDELLAWATAASAPQTTYLVHGEPEGAGALADRFHEDRNWPAVVARDGERVLL